MIRSDPPRSVGEDLIRSWSAQGQADVLLNSARSTSPGDVLKWSFSCHDTGVPAEPTPCPSKVKPLFEFWRLRLKFPQRVT